MDKKDELIRKLKELICIYKKRYGIDLDNDPFLNQYESEISALESEIKQEQCHAIYEKVKEAWTTECDEVDEPIGKTEMPDTDCGIFVITDKGIYDDDES